MKHDSKSQIYSISNNFETLTVVFLKQPDIVQVSYKKGRKVQIAAYKEGREIGKVLLNGEGHYIQGYKEAYERLGPELKKSLPPKWTKHLGLWFTSKEQLEKEKEEIQYMKNNFKILSLEDAGIGEYRIIEKDRVAEKQIDLSKGLDDLLKKL